jgi:hypothetical protein
MKSKKYPKKKNKKIKKKNIKKKYKKNQKLTNEISFSFSPEIAKQLTLIEYTLFSKIHPVELLSQSWNSRNARQHSTHVLDLIQRTNRLSFWISSLLLWQPTLQLRISILIRKIKNEKRKEKTKIV